MTGTPRRALLKRSVGLLGAAALASIPTSALLATPAYADSSYSKTPTGEEIKEAYRRFQENKARVRTGTTSSNGWEIEKITDGGGTIWTRPIPGIPVKGVKIRIGDAEILLVHLIRRYHYEIDPLLPGQVTGWTAPGKVRRGGPEDNLASGTAVRIRPGHYPPGTKGGFYPMQETVLRDILAELEGTVRWGGDDPEPDEALFYLAVKPGDTRLAKVVRKLHVWSEQPGRGAGGPVDILARSRRDAAKKLERRQRTA